MSTYRREIRIAERRSFLAAVFLAATDESASDTPLPTLPYAFLISAAGTGRNTYPMLFLNTGPEFI